MPYKALLGIGWNAGRGGNDVPLYWHLHRIESCSRGLARNLQNELVEFETVDRLFLEQSLHELIQEFAVGLWPQALQFRNPHLSGFFDFWETSKDLFSAASRPFSKYFFR